MSKSSIEAKYKFLDNAIPKVIWVQSLLCELGVVHPKAATMCCDNLVATYLSANHVFHDRKHIEVDYHFVRGRVTNKLLNVVPIPTAIRLRMGTQSL